MWPFNCEAGRGICASFDAEVVNKVGTANKRGTKLSADSKFRAGALNNCTKASSQTRTWETNNSLHDGITCNVPLNTSTVKAFNFLAKGNL